MIRPPTSIQIGPYHYSVVLDKHAINQVRVEGRSDAEGACDCSKQTITLTPDMHPDGLAETLLHEVMHAVHNTVGIGSKEKIVAHEMIYRTCPTILSVLRENPALVAFLMETQRDEQVPYHRG